MICYHKNNLVLELKGHSNWTTITCNCVYAEWYFLLSVTPALVTAARLWSLNVRLRDMDYRGLKPQLCLMASCESWSYLFFQLTFFAKVHHKYLNLNKTQRWTCLWGKNVTASAQLFLSNTGILHLISSKLYCTHVLAISMISFH